MPVKVPESKHVLLRDPVRRMKSSLHLYCIILPGWSLLSLVSMVTVGGVGDNGHVTSINEKKNYTTIMKSLN